MSKYLKEMHGQLFYIPSAAERNPIIGCAPDDYPKMLLLGIIDGCVLVSLRKQPSLSQSNAFPSYDSKAELTTIKIDGTKPCFQLKLEARSIKDLIDRGFVDCEEVLFTLQPCSHGNCESVSSVKPFCQAYSSIKERSLTAPNSLLR